MQAIGYSAWIEEQFAMPATPHLPYVQANYNVTLGGQNFLWMQDSFWQQAIPAQDQLRQRVKFALSQLVVISAENGFIAGTTDGLANYADLLGQHAFGNYRQLIEAVSTSSHHFVVGGAVRGQDVYGTFPDLTLNANVPTDAGNGRLIPTTSVEQYAATMAKWMGVTDANLEVILPNLKNFTLKTLPFMP